MARDDEVAGMRSRFFSALFAVINLIEFDCALLFAIGAYSGRLVFAIGTVFIYFFVLYFLETGLRIWCLITVFGFFKTS
jgi:hypothetical protein